MAELLVVTVILAVIGMTMYAALSSGVKIWNKVNERIGPEDVGILFEKFESDARNCARISGIQFSGSEDGVLFAGLVPSAVLGARTVGMIRYFYDPEDDAILRSARDIFGVYADKDGPVQRLLGDVKHARFSYYVYEKERKQYGWKEGVSGGEIPLAIRMEADVEYEGRADRFTKTVSIPVAD